MFQSCEAKVSMQLAGQKLRQSFLFLFNSLQQRGFKAKTNFCLAAVKCQSQPNIAHICCQRSRLNVR